MYPQQADNRLGTTAGFSCDDLGPDSRFHYVQEFFEKRKRISHVYGAKLYFPA